MDWTDRYIIAIDEQEVISSLFHMEEDAGFPTLDEAQAYLGTYEDSTRWHFSIYRVRIDEVVKQEEAGT